MSYERELLEWLRQLHTSGELVPTDWNWRVLQLLIILDRRLSQLEAAPL